MKRILLLLVLVFSLGVVFGQITEGFESGMPTSYTTGTITLGSGAWVGDNIIRGTTRNSGSYGCQIRSASGAQITSPMILSGGLGVVTFYARGSTSSGSVQVNYRVNGSSWTAATGSPFSLTTSFAQYTATINDGSANIEFQFLRTGATVYVDDVATTIYVASGNTVSFDPNGGTGTMADQIASSSTALTTNTFTRTGFAFTGWATSAGGAVVYADGANYNFSADITLYAQWKSIPTITNIVQSPTTVTATNVVTITADVTDPDGIFGVDINWGTTSGSLTNSVSMTNTSGNTYSGSIPAQTAGTTIYYEIYALDNNLDDNSSSELSYTVVLPPPANDLCAGTINIPVTIGSSCTPVTYTTLNATNSGESTACGGSNNSPNVWFSFTVPASGELNIVTSAGSTFTDGAMELYSGSCGSFTQLDCNDDYYGFATMPGLNLTGLTPNDLLYLLIWEYDGVNNGDFGICAWAPAPPVTELDFSASSFSAIENGVSVSICVDITNPDATNATTADVILTSTNTPHLTYTTQSITFPANSSTQQCVSVSLTDNVVCGDATSYTFELDNVSGGLNAAEGTTNTTTLNVGDNDAVSSTPFNETFSNFGTFTPVSISGSENWEISSGEASMNGYGSTGTAEDYLISASVDMSSNSAATLAFDLDDSYSGPALQIMYSTNFNGGYNSTDVNAATWTSVPGVTISSGTSSVSANVLAITGNNVYFAFYYTATGTGGGDAATWTVDDLSLNITACVTPEPEIKIEGNSTEIASGDVTPSTTDNTDFGSTALAGGTLVKTFTIYNTGDLALDLTGSPIVDITGANAADFNVSTLPVTPVAITTGSTTFQITFDPSALGVRNATISIANNDTDENPYTFAITGEGVNSNNSDIIENPSFTYEENIDYTVYQGNPINGTGTNAVSVFEFVIRDGGSSFTDVDALATELNAITFNVDKIANIREAALFDGATNVGTGTVSGSTIAFSGLTSSAADGSAKVISLKVSFENTVTDNDQLVFTIASATANSSYSVFAAADAGAATSSTALNDNTIEVTASKLAFTVQASDASINTSMAPAVKVSALDANNNLDLDYASNISISSTGTLTSAPVSVAPIAGVATFSSLEHTAVGTGEILTATDGSLSETSSAFNIVLVTYNHGDFRTTAGGGVWNNKNDGLSTVIWQKYNSVSGAWDASATSPSNSDIDVYILHNVEIPTSTTQHSTSKIIVENGATLTFKASNLWTFRNLIIKNGGTVDMQTRFTVLSGRDFEIEDGGNFWFNYSSNAASTLTSTIWNGEEIFHPNSNFIIKDHETGNGNYFLPTAANLTTQTYNGVTAYFGNLIFDGTGDARFTQSNLSSTSNYLTHGNLEFRPTSNVTLFYGSGSWIVGKDLIFKSGSTGNLTMTNQPNTINLDVKGDFINNSDNTFRVVNSSSATVTMNVDGNIDITNSGLVDLNFASGGTGTINLKGDLAVASSAQLFANNATTATFNFNGTGDGLSAATTQTIDVASTNTSKLDLNIKAGAYVQQASQNFELGEDTKLTVENGGSFDFGFNGTTALNLVTATGQTGTDFNLNSGGIIHITSPDGISTTASTGNVQTASQTLNGDAIFHFIGKVDQNTGNGLPLTARELNIEMENVDELTLTKALDVSSSISFDKGHIVTSTTNLLSLLDNATTNVATDNSYVSGPFKKIGNQAFVFPVGKDGNYQAIGISAPALVTDHFTAEYFQADPDVSYDNTSKEAGIDHISSCEYWILNRDAASAAAITVTLAWDANSCGVTNMSDLLVARWSTDDSEWQSHAGAASGTNAEGTITSAVVTDFSPFTLASSSGANPLPVELLYFQAENKAENVLVSWATVTEINNDFFTVERSENGVDFKVIGEIKGAGNYSGKLDYSFLDEKAFNGMAYYRLKQTDFDGSFEYSKIVSVSRISETSVFGSIYPNPAQNELNVPVSLAAGEALTIQIFDITGRKVYDQQLDSNAGFMIQKIDLNTLLSGTYLINVISDTAIKTSKFIKQ